MSKEKKLIPELRFPEFVKDGEWVKKELNDFCFNISSGKDKSIDNGVFDLYGSTGIIGKTENASYDGDYILVARVGANAGLLNKAIGKFGVTDNTLVINLKEDEKVDFIFYTLDKVGLNKLVFGSGQPLVTGKQLKDLNISIPNNPKEQQKIASCLSSLDELIAAHNEKLQALKDHKKGLMQNLFPQKGQKVPNYRFPDFGKDGEWVEKKLGNIGEPLMCKRIFKDQTTPNPENGVPFYKIGTFGKEPDSYIPVELYEEFKLKYNFPNKGDILISASGTIGRLVVYDGEPAYYQDSNIVWLGHDEKEVSNEFLFYCYSIVNWQTSDGGVIKRLYNTDLKAILIKFPENEKEQQKIASCLSAVDELITAQTEKIEQLQQHKKGLMQGLFPKIENGRKQQTGA
jgi:type I restriction enzyme S subunit